MVSTLAGEAQTSLVAQTVKRLPTMRETGVQSLVRDLRSHSLWHGHKKKKKQQFADGQRLEAVHSGWQRWGQEGITTVAVQSINHT